MKVSIKRQGRLIEKGGAERMTKRILKELEKAAKQIHEEELARIDAGRDVKGQFFPGYTDTYKPVRKKLGLKTSPVNLRVTGSLLDTIKNSVTLKGSRIEIVREIAPDQIAKASGLSKKRKFFGQTKRADEIIRSLLAKFNIKELLR